jgi:hypothetical protein
LEFCASYEYQMRATCDTLTSEWSPLQYFTTDGCCVNPSNFNVTNTMTDGAVITWNPVLAASGYSIMLIQGTVVVGNFETDQLSYAFTDLLACTDYQAVVSSTCVGIEPQVQTVSFTTMGCASCHEVATCPASTNDASGEWIANVTIGSINNTSVSDGGYGDYTDVTTDLAIGQDYSISVTPGFSGFSYNEYSKAWIDWNGDGDWTSDELIFDPGQASTTTATGTFNVPSSVSLGSKRLRVGMTYYGLFSAGETPDACGAFSYGEFEDYCVTIVDATHVAENNNQNWKFYPNPAHDVIRWEGPELRRLLCFDATGKCVAAQIYNKEQSGWIDVSSWPTGLYWMQWEIADGVNQSKIMVTHD